MKPTLRHLCDTPVWSPTEELQKNRRKSEDSGRWERTSHGTFFFKFVCMAVHQRGGCSFHFDFFCLSHGRITFSLLSLQDMFFFVADTQTWDPFYTTSVALPRFKEVIICKYITLILHNNRRKIVLKLWDNIQIQAHIRQHWKQWS